MRDFARWFAVVSLSFLAIGQSWVVIKGYGHRLVKPVFLYGAFALWIAFLYRLIVALGLTRDIVWIRDGTFAAFLTVFMAAAISLGGYAGFLFSKKNGDTLDEIGGK